MSSSLARPSIVVALAALALAGVPRAVPAQAPPAAERFVEIAPADGRGPVWLAPAQVVRVARLEGRTAIDTAAWVQQATSEPVEAIARRLMATGLRLAPLTDLRGERMYVALDRVVLVRSSEERHAAGARASLVMTGLRFNIDVAVRESVEQVMAALARAG